MQLRGEMWDQCILSEEFFESREAEDLRQAAGVYLLFACADGSAARPLPRAFGGSDALGILYIGRSGTTRGRSIYSRLKEFWNHAHRGTGNHTAGVHYSRANCGCAFSLDEIGVRWKVLGAIGKISLKAVQREEIALIGRYAQKFKELPPFNHSWPKD